MQAEHSLPEEEREDVSWRETCLEGACQELWPEMEGTVKHSDQAGRGQVNKQQELILLPLSSLLLCP
jgi:hypothetical protein